MRRCVICADPEHTGWPCDSAKLADVACDGRRIKLAKLAIAWAKQQHDPILVNAECVALYAAVNELWAIEGMVDE